MAAQHGLGDATDVHPANLDGAAVDFVEPREEVDDGGLAGAGGAHQGHHLARGRGEGQVVDDGGAGAVGKGHVGEGDLAPGGWQQRAIIGFVGGAVDFDGRVHDFKDAFGAGEGRLDGVGEIRQLPQGIHEILAVADERRDDAHGDEARRCPADC